MEAVSALGVRLRLASKADLWKDIEAATPNHLVRVATVNAEFFLEAAANPAFADTLAWMTHCTVDGSGPEIWLGIAARAGRGTPPPRYAGATLVEDLFVRFQDGSRSILLLGDGKAPEAAAILSRRFPSATITGLPAGSIDASNPLADEALLSRVAEVAPDILLVGFGAPKQEAWIRAASQRLSVPVMVGVGGSFSFYTTTKRAPRLMQAVGLEWLWRAATVPGHWRRALRAVFGFSWFALGRILRGR